MAWNRVAARYKQTYNLNTGVVRACELRYDMRPTLVHAARAAGTASKAQALWAATSLASL